MPTSDLAGSDIAVPRGFRTTMSRFRRYVAIGDSSTEGLDDPDGRGGYHGWANRLAEHVARTNDGPLLYANLAVRGRHTRAIREEQLERALAMEPDLATIFAGTNDVVSKHFDADAVARELELIQRALVGCGATVLSFTLPDLTPVLPAARRLAPRVEALNDALREVARTCGTRLVDFAAFPVSSDPRLWSDDRLHANSLGHQRIAAALAHALGLPGSDESWQHDLPPRARRSAAATIGAELAWTWRHLLPWLWRHAWGRSSGDGRTAKRPELAVVVAGAGESRGIDSTHHPAQQGTTRL